MSIDKKLALVALFWFVVGGVCGFFVGKGMYDQPIKESVTRDTTTTIDTIPDIAPAPKDSTPVRTVIRWLPMKLHKKSGANPYPASTDTVEQWQYFGIAEQLPQHPQDSELIEIPITSKHYQSPEYDAWVSGYEPSLDSIKVYRETQYITETVTKSKPPNKWEMDLVGGINYNFNKKKYTPHVGGELLYKPNRLQLGVRGGVEYTDKVEPVIGAVAKIKIF